MPSVAPALFLDRDGVINLDVGYAHLPEHIVFIDGLFDLCVAAQQRGYRIVIVTNQSGIARGMYTEAQFHLLSSWIKERFLEHGISIDGIYFCPHGVPGDGNEETEQCACRKPLPGMIFSAQKDLQIDLGESILIGDKLSDIECARAAGVATRVLFRGDSAALEGSEHIFDSLIKIKEFLFEQKAK